MKKAICMFIGFLGCIVMTACGIAGDLTSSISDISDSIPEINSEDSSGEQYPAGSQTSIFRSLTANNGNPITGQFDVYLSETEAVFLYIEVQEETKVTMDFTYTTHEKPGVKFGYYLEGEDDKTTFELESATDEAYDTVWTAKKITLQKGMNVFYLSGEDVSCSMRYEISGAEQSKVTYVGAFPRQEFVA